MARCERRTVAGGDGFRASAERRFGALAIANTASGTHVEIAIESAYRAHGELEARDRMVDARAIAYMIPCGRPRGPAGVIM